MENNSECLSQSNILSNPNNFYAGLVGLKSQLKMENDPAKTSWAHGVNDKAFLKSSLMGKLQQDNNCQVMK